MHRGARLAFGNKEQANAGIVARHPMQGLFARLGPLVIGTPRLMSVALDVLTLEEGECINLLVRPSRARVGATSPGTTKAKLPAQSLAPTPSVAIFHDAIALSLAAPHRFQRQLSGRCLKRPLMKK
jgi:hypothetical protein